MAIKRMHPRCPGTGYPRTPIRALFSCPDASEWFSGLKLVPAWRFQVVCPTRVDDGATWLTVSVVCFIRVDKEIRRQQREGLMWKKVLAHYWLKKTNTHTHRQRLSFRDFKQSFVLHYLILHYLIAQASVSPAGSLTSRLSWRTLAGTRLCLLISPTKDMGERHKEKCREIRVHRPDSHHRWVFFSPHSFSSSTHKK